MITYCCDVIYNVMLIGVITYQPLFKMTVSENVFLFCKKLTSVFHFTCGKQENLQMPL